LQPDGFQPFGFQPSRNGEPSGGFEQAREIQEFGP